VPSAGNLGDTLALAAPALALAAFVTGVVATVRARRRRQPVWMAVTGIVSGALVLAATLVVLALVLPFLTMDLS